MSANHSHKLCLNSRQIKDAALSCQLVQSYFPDLEVRPRTQLKFNEKFMPSVLSNAKRSTVRFAHKSVEFPEKSVLPVSIVTELGVEISNTSISVKITKVIYKEFKYLDDLDAERDGFESAPELKNELLNIYGRIGDDDVVSIFYIAAI